MRIDRFDLISYGHFTEKTLDLSGGEQGLHLIYGDNEAGKSTSLRALIAWLFGIPVRTKDNYLHDNPQLRLGGKLRLSTGEELEFIRRKGIKGTLLEPCSDKIFDDSVLRSFFPAGMDEVLFRKFHGIDHPGLVAGGKELLHESGDLGQALLSAAVGTAGFRKILSELHSSAEELFAPRASQKRINRAVADFKVAKKRIKEASLPVAEWKSLQKQLAETLVHIREVEDNIGVKTRGKNRLARCNRVKAVLAEHKELTSRIADQGKVLFLPEDFDEKRKMWSERLQIALETKERAMAKVSRLEKEVQSLNINHELLDKEESILSIYKELGAVEKTVKDRPQQDGKRRLLRNDAEALLKGVRPDVAVDDAEQLRPLLNKKKWLASLVQNHSLLRQKRDKALSIQHDIQNEQQRAGKKRTGLSHLKVDLGELKASVATARKSGDLEQRLIETQKRERAARAGCELERKRLGRFTGSVAELLQTAMPVTATLDLFEKNIDDLDEQLRNLNRKREELEEETKQKEHTRKVLLLTDEVPTLQDLEESRNIRNRGWSLIKSEYIHKDVVDVNRVQIAHATDLAFSYEEKVEGADRVSDQLRMAADQVAKRADLEVQIEDLTSQLSNIEKKNCLAIKARDDCQKKWDEIWQLTGIQAGTPREMRQWLLKVEALSANVQFAYDIADDVKQLNGDCTLLKENISRQITRFDNLIDLNTMSLEAMIIVCEQRIEKEESVLEKKRQLDHLLEDLKIRKKRVDEELQAIDGEQANWRDEWVKAIDGLGLPFDVHPEPATETFDRLVAFFEKLDQSEELRKRIYGIDQVVEKFKTAVFTFTDAIGFKSDGLESIAIAAQLHRDLNVAREARASLRKIEIQCREIREEREEAEITIRNAEKQFAEFKKMAGVGSDDELQQASDKSKKARLLRQKLDTLEQELIRNGDGLTVQELKKEASELDSDIIESELERVVAELAELQENRDVLRDKRQMLVSEIGAKDDSGIAALASEEAEQHRAMIVSGVEHYLRLRAAALILEQKIEEYRKKNQAPILARAGEIFARMTLGSYKGLRDELDNGKPILLGVRPDEKEVAVGGMSDGTRDQLYLALRLASLEQHLSKGEPLPFIVDDILIGFDDKRTRVCLQVLSELSQTTQVLLFTHHHRVIELAETHGTGDVFVHELGAMGGEYARLSFGQREAERANSD